MSASFGHFVFLFDDDGIVSASASNGQGTNSKEPTASKLSSLEMSPFDKYRFDTAVAYLRGLLVSQRFGVRADGFIRATCATGLRGGANSNLVNTEERSM